MVPGSFAPISRILSCHASRGDRARQSCILNARYRALPCDSNPDCSGNTVLHTGTHLAVSPLWFPKELAKAYSTLYARRSRPFGLERLCSQHSFPDPLLVRECAGVTRYPCPALQRRAGLYVRTFLTYVLKEHMRDCLALSAVYHERASPAILFSAPQTKHPA